eukprot:TRINITY_DN12688_c0_g1_i1.p1 TRINITY_DN12688_c0_g1~~TRINITY_DN12688_c0_g1_i1.p1  ORF type:complete len:1768 (+),score=385.45 TRINITY_DN12688_c0_g1_i1:782-5305(+)
MEIGRFPAGVTRMLAPLLERRLVDVEVRVGDSPPRELTLGATIRVNLVVSLHSAAFSRSARSPAVGTPAATGGSSKSKNGSAQLTVAQEEEDSEVLRVSVGEMLEQMHLPRRRSPLASESAVDGAEVGADPGSNVAGAGAAAPTASGGGEDAEAVDGAGEEEADTQEMSRQAAAQLGGREELERLNLDAVEIPENLFKARLRPYQAQAVFWMWQRENPSSELPPAWRRATGRDGDSKAVTENGDAAAAASEPNPSSGEPAGGGDNDEERLPLHPMWDEYELRDAVGPLPGRRTPTRFLYHHRTTGALSLDLPHESQAHCRGGILADDMGLGKTVMCLALVALDLSPVPNARTASAAAMKGQESKPAVVQRHLTSMFKPAAQGDALGSNMLGGVLVVAPLSLMAQWQKEVDRHFATTTRPRVCLYHGANRKQVAGVDQLRACGLVLTTYAQLHQEQLQDGPVFKVHWRRVILDEAHVIKNRCAAIAQAAFRLQAWSRWCVTGTPLQNNIDEMYSFVRFLRIEPFSTWPVWRKAVTVHLERSRHGDSKALVQALDAARRIMQPVMIRRTKSSKDPVTGEVLVELPPKHVHVVELTLSVAERDFYDSLFEKSKTAFDNLVSTGKVTVNYTHVLQLIMTLRQALCHPFLVFAKKGSMASDGDLQGLEQRCLREMTGDSDMSERFVENLMQDLRTGTLSDCPICCDTPEDPAMTPCGHIFCRECALKAIGPLKGECPVCRRVGALSRKTLKALPGGLSRFPPSLLSRFSSAAAAADGAAVTDGAVAGSNPAHSTKMKELIRLLREDMVAGRRVVVFSQWTSFLSLVGTALESCSIPFRQFDGSLTLEARQQRVAWLSEKVTESDKEGDGRVLLTSLKAGGVGLNLIAASRAYLLDQWWNPAGEEQAIQRVHRIGQTAEVHVYKFVVNDSIDTDLLELHKAKSRLLEDVMEGGNADLATKLTVDDLKRIFSPCRASLKALREGSEVNTSAVSMPTQPSAPVIPEAPSIAAMQDADVTQPGRPQSANAAALIPPPPSAPAIPEALPIAAMPDADETQPRRPEWAQALEAELDEAEEEACGAVVPLGDSRTAAPAEGASTVTPPSTENAPGENGAPRPAAINGAKADFAPVAEDEDDDDDELSDSDLLAACAAFEAQTSASQAAPPPVSVVDARVAMAPPEAPASATLASAPVSAPEPVAPFCDCEPPEPAELVNSSSEGPGGSRQYFECPVCNFFEWVNLVNPLTSTQAAPAAFAPAPEAEGAKTSPPKAARRGNLTDFFGGGGGCGAIGTGPGAGGSSASGSGKKRGRGSTRSVGSGRGWRSSFGSDGGGDDFGGDGMDGGEADGPAGGPFSGGGGGFLGGGGSGPDGACFKCGQPGHWARDCRQAAGKSAVKPASQGGSYGLPPPAADDANPPMCRCNPPQQPKEFTVRKEGPTQGQTFFKCGDCGYFEWGSGGGAGGAGGGAGFGGGGGFGRSGTMGGSAGFTRGGGGGGGECFRCGQTGHWASTCPTRKK